MDAERTEARQRDSPDDTRVEKRPRREMPASNGDTAQLPSTSGSAPGTGSHPGAGTASGSGSVSQDSTMKCRKVLLANLPYDVTSLQVTNFFKRHRLDVDSVKLLGINEAKQQCNGNAFVYFVDDRAVSDAVKLDNELVNGRSVRIHEFNGQRTVCVRCNRGQATKAEIEALFEGFDLEGVRSAPPRNDHHYPTSNNMTWFVDFVDEVSFEKAISTDRSVDGLVVCVATPSSRSRNRDMYGRRDDRRPNRSPPYGRGPRGGGGDYDRYNDRRDQDRRGSYNNDYREREGDSRHGGGRFERRGPDRRDDERGPDLGRGNSRDGMEPSNSMGRGRDRFRDQNHDTQYNPDRRRSFDRNRERRDGGQYPPRDMDYHRGPRDHERGPRGHDRFNNRSRDDSRRDGGMDRRGGRGVSPFGGGDDRLAQRQNDMDDAPYHHRGRRGDDDRQFNNRDRFNKDWDGDNGRFRGREREDYRPRRDNRDRYQRDNERPRNSYDRSGGGSGRPEFITGLIESAITEANRFCGDVDEELTIVISSLPFQDDRGYMSENVRTAFTSVHPDIKIKYIFPAGRRCGHCFVVFEDVRSRDMALGMRMVSVFDRPANVHPLEKPYLVRFHKLLGSSTPERVAADLQKDFEIQGVHAAPDFGEFCFFRVDETKDFVRLLAVDGFPYHHGRLVSVSYYQGKRPFSAGGQQRRSNRDYDDDRRDRNGDYRPGSGGDYRGGGGGSGGVGGHPPRSNDDNGRRDDGGGGQDRGYNDSGATRHRWNVRLTELPKDSTEKEVISFLSSEGIKDVSIRMMENNTAAEIGGRRNCFSVMQKILMLNTAQFRKEDGGGKIEAVEVTPKRPSLPPKHDKGTSAGPSDFEMTQAPLSGQKRSLDYNDGNERPSKKAAVSTPEGRNFGTSPVTPPSVNDEDVAMEEADAWKMPDVVARFQKLKDTIINGGEVEDDIPFMTVVENYKSQIDESYVSKYGEEDDDIEVPVIWEGGLSLKNGDVAKTNAYLVQRQGYDEKEVERLLGLFPKDLEIGGRIDAINPGWSHLVHRDAVVFMLRGDQDEIDLHMTMDPKDRPEVTSRSILLGIIGVLKTRQRRGLVRFDKEVDGKMEKYGVVLLPPTALNLDQLNIPWRFRDLIAHDALLVVIGKKASTAEVGERRKRSRVF